MIEPVLWLPLCSWGKVLFACDFWPVYCDIDSTECSCECFLSSVTQGRVLYLVFCVHSDSIESATEHYGLQRVSLLRGFCRAVGVQLLLREFSLEVRNKQLFHEEDIVNVSPVVKHISPRVCWAGCWWAGREVFGFLCVCIALFFFLLSTVAWPVNCVHWYCVARFSQRSVLGWVFWGSFLKCFLFLFDPYVLHMDAFACVHSVGKPVVCHTCMLPKKLLTIILNLSKWNLSYMPWLLGQWKAKPVNRIFSCISQRIRIKLIVMLKQIKLNVLMFNLVKKQLLFWFHLRRLKSACIQTFNN